MAMRLTRKPAIAALGVALLFFATWIAWSASAWVGRPFPGLLLLENSVVASAGLTSWPAVSEGRIFQHEPEHR